MKILGWIVALAAIAFALPVHAQDRVHQGTGAIPPAAVGGPLALTYVISGVRDNGGSLNTGVATSFHCTNTNTVSEQIQIVVRKFDGTITSNNTFTLTSARTHTASTHGTVAFNEDAFLSEGIVIDQGMAFIFATSQFVFCSAMITDASTAGPVGVSLHMVRFSPLSGTQE
jgi:hypothetical protein